MRGLGYLLPFADSYFSIIPRLFFGFVVFGNQPIQQANAVARTPAVIDLGLRRAHRGSRDIEMRPWRIVDETLQELGGGDGAAVACTGILHVGELRIHQLVVFRTERHAPDFLAGLEADL